MIIEEEKIITLDHEHMNQVESFKYLGSKIHMKEICCNKWATALNVVNSLNNEFICKRTDGVQKYKNDCL